MSARHGASCVLTAGRAAHASRVDPLLTPRRDILIGWRAWRHARRISSSTTVSAPANAAARKVDEQARGVDYGASPEQEARRERDRAEWARRQMEKEQRIMEEESMLRAKSWATKIEANLSPDSATAQGMVQAASKTWKDMTPSERQAYYRSQAARTAKAVVRDPEAAQGQTLSPDLPTPLVFRTESPRGTRHRARSAYTKKTLQREAMPAFAPTLSHQNQGFDTVDNQMLDLAMSVGSSTTRPIQPKRTVAKSTTEDLQLQQMIDLEPAEMHEYDQGLDEAAMLEAVGAGGQYIQDEHSESDLDYQAAVEDLWQQSLDETDQLEASDIFGAQVRQVLTAPALPGQNAYITQPKSLKAPREQGFESYGWLDGEAVPTRFDFSSHAGQAEEQQPQPRRKVRRVPVSMDKLQPGDPWHEQVATYRERFGTLLEIEQEEEHAAVVQRLTSRPLGSLEREGYALAELAGHWADKWQFGKPNAIFRKVGKLATSEFTWNRFTPGSTVIISRTDPLVDAVLHSETRPGGPGSGDDDDYLLGSVYRKTRGEIQVVFEREFDIEDGKWRLDLWITDIILQRMKLAMAALHADPLQQDREKPEVVVHKKPQDDKHLVPSAPQTRKVEDAENILCGTALRDILLDGFGDSSAKQSSAPSKSSVLFKDPTIKDWAERHLVPDGEDIVSKPSDPPCTLNRSQKRAIAAMLAYPVSLIQGPPGTGKTRTIVETLWLLKSHWKVKAPMLVSAYTNAAVDNLAEGLAARGLKTLRFGVTSRIREDLDKLTLEYQQKNHRLWPSYEANNRALALLGEKTGLTKEEQEYRDRLERKKYALEHEILLDILASVDVICSTCISSASRLLKSVDFPIVFLDEASMATEPASLIALVKGSAHVAIIGDHKQLPPVIISDKAREGGLAVSLFERLINRGDVPSVMLDTQYRMHPDISEFPNRAFYGGELCDGRATAEQPAPRTAFLAPNEQGGTQRVSFVDHDFPEVARSKSLANEGDADIVCDVIADLMYENPHLRGADIGVIAPYTAQIALIERKKDSDIQRKQAFEDLLGEDRAAELANIEVKTVDGFEGREKQVIIFSTVRNNMAGNIGFLVDWRRMNVALTRAKRALIMVGSARTLRNARNARSRVAGATAGGEIYWRQFVKSLVNKGAIIKPVQD